MSTEKIKEEINKILDQFSENALQYLLSFLKKAQQPPSLFSDDYLKKLLAEDKELFERLAQG